MIDSFKTRSTLQVGKTKYEYFDLHKLPSQNQVQSLPYALKILLENLLRTQDEVSVKKEDIEALIHWDPHTPSNREIAFTPSRVILQDFTGVPAIVDLAAMRDAMQHLGGQPSQINPLSPVELVIDHSVMVDHFGTRAAFKKNTSIEIQRNHERYRFLRWGQEAFQNFKVVPPGTGIVHQVNLEYLARVVFHEKQLAFPDTVVGTDSHTTMINGLGVLGWGVGGIEAEAAMLGQPITMLIPEVIGFELKGTLPEGTTATDLVLTITELLRKKVVVGKFVEFYGEGLAQLPLADRATIANMAPEYGATCGIFPIDEETIRYLSLTGRSTQQCALIKAYAQAQGLFQSQHTPPAKYSDVLVLDLKTIVPSIAGPKRPQDRIALPLVKQHYQTLLKAAQKEITLKINDLQTITKDLSEGAHIVEDDLPHKVNGAPKLKAGAVVIAAITSCTNTSNPAVMIAAALLAKAAHARGLKPQPWVKTSFAPGSQVVSDYLARAGLMSYLEALGFDLVGYGCTTCIGNSGPLPKDVSDAIYKDDLTVAAVLSGNRNFEGRIHPEVRHAFLASPPLVVAYALAGTINIDFYKEPLGKDTQNEAVYLKDIWPTQQAIEATIHSAISPDMFSTRYAQVFEGDQEWKNLSCDPSELYEWHDDSTYVKNPPYFTNMPRLAPPLQDIKNARVLAKLGDSVTTDHISPAGAIDPHSPAGQYLIEKGIDPHDFNSYGSRRGNHEVMMRGTFANIRLRNQLAPGTEGGWTKHQPSDESMTIYDAALRYKKENTDLIVLAGKEYGTGSSRDWAAKGTNLLGVKAVIAESFERIHRSNLIGMGVLPLQFMQGNADILQLTGKELYNIAISNLTPQGEITVFADQKSFQVRVRIDTPKELAYYQNGGILHYVLRQLAKKHS